MKCYSFKITKTTPSFYSSCGHRLQHWLYQFLVFASSLFVGVDQTQSLHNPETQLPNENAGLPIPQQLRDLTLAEVEHLLPVIAPVPIPIFGPLGLLRYPTKPISMAVQVGTAFICTYLQGPPPVDYEYVVHDLLSSEVPQAYTTIKTEQRAKKNMMGVVRENGPVNWYNAPLELYGKLFRFPWPTEMLRKIINTSSRANSNSRTNYTCKLVQVPNRLWKNPNARGKEHLDHQIQYLDFARVHQLIEEQRRNLSHRMAPCSLSLPRIHKER